MEERGSMAKDYNVRSSKTKLDMAKLQFKLKEEELCCVTFHLWLGLDSTVLIQRQFLP